MKTGGHIPYPVRLTSHPACCACSGQKSEVCHDQRHHQLLQQPLHPRAAAADLRHWQQQWAVWHQPRQHPAEWRHRPVATGIQHQGQAVVTWAAALGAGCAWRQHRRTWQQEYRCAVCCRIQQSGGCPLGGRKQCQKSRPVPARRQPAGTRPGAEQQPLERQGQHDSRQRQSQVRIWPHQRQQLYCRTQRHSQYQ